MNDAFQGPNKALFDALIVLLVTRYDWFAVAEAQMVSSCVSYYLELRKMLSYEKSKERTIEMFDRELARLGPPDGSVRINADLLTEALTLWHWACEGGASPLPSTPPRNEEGPISGEAAPKKQGPCSCCGAPEYEILEGDDFHRGYTGYGVTSCCHAV